MPTGTQSAKLAPMYEINHSGALNPIILIHDLVASPRETNDRANVLHAS